MDLEAMEQALLVNVKNWKILKTKEVANIGIK